ncbi:MAG: hypothetical protein BGO07_05020 [Alphaproteobacteria bacterium 40-19]|nr:MAG: hypothetical protein BGO07_05020 [Alphaproteobacteria bacterium 40-19]
MNRGNEAKKDHVESVEFKIFESKFIHFFDYLVNVKFYQDFCDISLQDLLGAELMNVDFCDNTIIDLDILGREKNEKVRFLESFFREKDNQLTCLNSLNQKILDKEEALKKIKSYKLTEKKVKEEADEK